MNKTELRLYEDKLYPAYPVTVSKAGHQFRFYIPKPIIQKYPTLDNFMLTYTIGQKLFTLVPANGPAPVYNPNKLHYYIGTYSNGKQASMWLPFAELNTIEHPPKKMYFLDVSEGTNLKFILEFIEEQIEVEVKNNEQEY